jgi:hypothetical protein
MNDLIQCGDKVQCGVTGFTGIAVSVHEYLHGCRRITVQPKLDTTGNFQDDRTFDEPQLNILERANFKPKVVSGTGGPDKFVPAQRSIGAK